MSQIKGASVFHGAISRYVDCQRLYKHLANKRNYVYLKNFFPRDFQMHLLCVVLNEEAKALQLSKIFYFG